MTAVVEPTRTSLPVSMAALTPRVDLVADRVDVSVLVPAKDEAENLPLFMQQAEETFAQHPTIHFEVVVVDDGSADDTWSVLGRLRERYPFLRVARHRVRRGIADALRTGYQHARGHVLVFY